MTFVLSVATEVDPVSPTDKAVATPFFITVNVFVFPVPGPAGSLVFPSIKSPVNFFKTPALGTTKTLLTSTVSQVSPPIKDEYCVALFRLTSV